MTVKTPHHIVVGISVSGGFLGGVSLEFVDGLNCLIGGRGAGKTTALELLRFGIGLMPDSRLHSQRHKNIDSLIKGNLAGGKVSVALRTKDGLGYTAERRVHEEVLVSDELGQAVPVSLGNDLIFGADVFSQNEIEEIASDPAAQLELLDRFAGPKTRKIEKELESLGRRLDQSAQILTRLDDETEALAAQASELPALQERLKGLAEVTGPDADRLNAAHAQRESRQHEALVPSALIAAVDGVVTDIGRAKSAYRARWEVQLTSAVVNGVNAEVFRALASELDSFSAALDIASREVAEAAKRFAAAQAAAARRLAALHAKQEAEYRALVSTSEELGGRSAERAKLQGAVAAAQANATALRAKEQERSDAVGERQQLLNRMSELRHERFAMRKDIAGQITRKLSVVRVTVAQGEDLGEYQQFLTDALKGSGVQQGVAARQLVQQLLPAELARIVSNENLARLVDKTRLPEDRARKILLGLRAPGVVYAMEALDLHDQPCIELLDGESYKQSPNLSTGQRCTTILPILLLQSERPLLIDQPEDNLDNAFVYETVVKALRQVKGSRQVIFVTHNPNIPVLGQADRVFVFSSDGARGSVSKSGTVDDCKHEIEQILEGGREAFQQRYKRYGH